MVDFVTVVLLASSAFFVVLSLGLIFRYRQVSTQISSSNDLGHDLWEALEARMKKQDERILDMMGRVEVIQSRVVEKQARSSRGLVGPASLVRVAEGVTGVFQGESQRTASRIMSQLTPTSGADDELRRSLESRLSEQDERFLEVMNRLEALQSHLPAERTSVSATVVRRSPSALRSGVVQGNSREADILRMLNEKARTSVEIRQQFSISREHAARLLKDLFDKGLVTRNDSHKPFVYELTETGRRSLLT